MQKALKALLSKQTKIEEDDIARSQSKDKINIYKCSNDNLRSLSEFYFDKPIKSQANRRHI